MTVHWLGEPECHVTMRVGGKAASLSQLASEFEVPGGFAIPAVTVPVAETVAEALYSEVVEAYAELERRAGVTDLPVAVRSSAIDEDGAQASFAGQHDTYLNVRGADAVFDAVRRCWASAHSELALQYREMSGLDGDDIQIAVLVQQLVEAEVAGVAFSANPVTGNRDEVMITTSWGLGESVVSGTVTPDMFVVHKQTQSVTAELGAKERMTALHEDGTLEVPVPPERQGQLTLSEEQAREVAALAHRLEQSMGFPVDIECAYHAGRLYLLQCRPITTLS
jgi:phosphoenolpyruvate synthase/pyruvate phosphate dikinase